MKDPLSALYESYPYNPEEILATAVGSAYVAIMLTTGEIGVCSTLNKPVTTDPLTLYDPDLNKHDHRVLITAFINAHANYKDFGFGQGDIFDQIDFSKKSNIVMIGFFPPLVQKFQGNGISFNVFDQQKEGSVLTPASELEENLGKSDCIILTSTTITNLSFSGIISMANEQSITYLLGPSTPMHSIFKDQFNITQLFGMVFKPYDFEVLGIISKGFGTQSFSKKGKKVSL
jgi:uncharacterized protein (DUF4213/DUF364 family)